MDLVPGPAALPKPRTPRPPDARRRVHPPRAPLLFPGWFVVLGAFLVVMVGYGAINSYGAFAEEIAAEFGSSRTSVSLIYALSGGACFLVSAISGPLADRVGPRMLAATGMIMVGLGLALAATARSLAEVLASAHCPTHCPICSSSR